MSDHDPNLATDPELLAGFFDEAQEALGTLDALFVKLEATPNDVEVVEAIFRPVHSLKGNSAFFGFMAAKHLAHELETLLDYVRKDRLQAARPVIDVLLAGLDELKAMFARLRSGGDEVADPQAFDTLVQRVVQQSAGSGKLKKPETIAADADDVQSLRDLEALAGMIPVGAPAEAFAALARLRSRFAKTKTVSIPLGPFQALKSILSPPVVGGDESSRVTAVQTELERLRTSVTDDAMRQLVAEMVDGFHAFVEAMGFDAMLRDFLLERITRGERLASASPASEALEAKPTARERTDRGERERTDRVERKDGKSSKDDPAKTMRVAESTIDTFLHYVGELLVVGDLFGHLYRRVAGLPNTAALARDFRRANETFTALSNKLQKSIMAIRRVPIRPLLNKVPRLVRDVSAAQGKEARVVLMGEDVQVDKSLIDLLDAPMTHMVRNAADHGIEPPDVRERQGKPRQGTITITAAETDASLILTIEDDGAGLNLDAIRRKGENLGLIAPNAALTENDIVNLIFASGVSTAKEVTDISGRGVGMDVVKRAVEEAGGAIGVTTQKGEGSRFHIKLPKGVTTQIMPGYLLRSCGRVYVLPLDRIHETFLARPDDINTITGKGRCLTRHGVILPVLSLATILEGQDPPWPAKGATMVTVMANRRKLALVVDGVLGVQKVVIRPMTGLPAGADMIAGGALLGDGTVALILNLDRVQEVA